MKNILLIILILLGFLIYEPAIFAQQNTGSAFNSSISQDERENISVYKMASAAVVSIKSFGNTGAGCIIDPSGIIVTNKHVIAGGYNPSVSLADGKSYQVSVLDVDNDDLAILKIKSNGKFPYLKVGDSSKIEVGQRVLAIGNPFGLERTLTTGIISRIDYNLNRIQTDAAINPGNSGGPLLNAKGELIGINQAIVNPSGRSNSGIGFAIPSNTVKRLLALSHNAQVVQSENNSGSFVNKSNQSKPASIVYQNKVFLGVAGQNLPGDKVVVVGVEPGSPAYNAGLRYRDIVLALDSVQVKTFDDIGFALKDKQPGDQVNLLYIRDGKVNNSTAVLVPRN